MYLLDERNFYIDMECLGVNRRFYVDMECDEKMEMDGRCSG